MPARTTILVLSVDEADLLAGSLPLAAAQPGAELVVIDNACTDGTRAVAERHGAHVVALEQRLSYAAAMNAGLRVALAGLDAAKDDPPAAVAGASAGASSGGAGDRPGAVLLLNADCFLHPGFLAAALPRLAESRIGSVAPKLVRTSGPPEDPALDPQPAETIDAAGMTIDRRRKNSLVGHGRPATRYVRPGEAFGADGACALYRADTLRDCGPEWFDERMALWASDADLAWRARRAGWRCAYEPTALARHIRTYSPTTRASTSREHRRIQFRNRLLMIARNETRASLRANAAPILAYEVAALGFALIREPFLLRGYAEAARALPATRRRRKADHLKPQGGAEVAPFGLEPDE